MFKDFSSFNTWLSSHFQTEISAVVTRAVNRVTSIRQRLSQIHSEYTSAYNSVQTLGYDQQGAIVDNTSSERLTIPDASLTKMKAYLSTQRESLDADRDAFISLYGSALAGALPKARTTGLESATMKIISLNGFGQVMWNLQTNKAIVIVDNGAFTAVPQIGTGDEGYGYLPYIWFGNNFDWQSGLYANGLHAPDIYSPQLRWRATITNVTGGYKFVTVEFRLSNHNYAVSGEVANVDSITGAYFTNELTVGNALLFNSVATYRTLILNNTGVNLGTDYGVFVNPMITKLKYSDATSAQKTNIDRVFSYSLHADVKTAYIISKADSAIAGDMFDTTMSLTPSDIDAAIATL